MTSPLRLGIVGTGSITLRGLLPHLTLKDVSHKVNITALCDPVIERANEAANKYNVPNAYANFEDMLADDQFDAISIASPIGLHFEQGKEAA